MEEIELSLRSAFESALSRFDFELVHAYMTLVNWIWLPIDKVPDIPYMKKSLREDFAILCKHCENWNEGFSVGSGGFKILVSPDAQSVEIEFCIKSSSAYWN